MRPVEQDSDTVCGVLHVAEPESDRNDPDFRPVLVVEFLHRDTAGRGRSAGFGVVEVIVAIAVLGLGILGVAALGSGARRLADLSAQRSAQVALATAVLEGAPVVAGDGPRWRSDTTLVGDRLIELRVTVEGGRTAGPLIWIGRRRLPGP